LLLAALLSSCIPTLVLAGDDEEGEMGTKIIGGVPAGANEFNFFGHGFPSYSCGASLIHPQIILTAAHCECGFANRTRTQLILLGTNELLKPDTALDEVPTTGVRVVHPDYTSDAVSIVRNDIMLVKLSRPATVAPVPWATAVPADGSTATAVGFGSIAPQGPGSPILLKVDVPVVSFATCNNPSNYNGQINSNSMLCAGIPGKDACSGALDWQLMPNAGCPRP
jgi:secreted trypsin-like serine protease